MSGFWAENGGFGSLFGPGMYVAFYPGRSGYSKEVRPGKSQTCLNLEDFKMIPVRRNYNQDWLPELFSDFFENGWWSKAGVSTLAINVSEDEKAYTVEVAAPGMNKEDFKLCLSDEDHLMVTLEKKGKKEDENKRYLRKEFSYAKFQQSLILPEDVDREQISARVNDGILTIDLHKKNINSRVNEPKEIEIQ